MSYSSFTAASALRRLAGALERMSEDEISRLIDPNCDIEIKVIRRRSKEEISPETLVDLNSLVAKLTMFPSRAEASQFMETAFETKKTLDQIARHLDVPVLKQDKVETLRDKIIEATVGARLRSEAIKGTG
ncbi:hypothetical protein GFK26_31640 [Variovorax paradoxus]|uniref:Uncharacterized protein n=1 Tax=Variovorax paradoxus TaxID=34073 RepID=A0A5Q0MEA6_VARPD|nr:hypothetical protein [Variovorax paradoxus]QFZ87004.1 hypothetical protein GFK26_31640 [Variovorax paradoxus]